VCETAQILNKHFAYLDATEVAEFQPRLLHGLLQALGGAAAQKLYLTGFVKVVDSL
jgi:hypothetical protein